LVVVPRKVRSRDKIFPNYKDLVAILQSLQNQGKVVVLTNGVFDLLHVGHTRYLEDARARGDFLVVAVNSDRTAERLKGKGHPVQTLQDRMEVLASLWVVDYVTSFDEDTAEELLRRLKPAVYCKGTDYTLKTLPERGVLRELDVRVLFVGDKKSHSSRKLIQKIRKRKFAM
jgi:D-beta-D-heptose 7-phosphate kinase/D-beta-D-heptose 1-phosphate adenosyltransferase